MWQSYTGAAIEQTAGLPRHFIFYEDLIHSHREEVSRLARFLGRPDALEQPTIPAAIEDFIDPEFHRHRTSLVNTLDNPNILFPAKALYFAVRIAARSGGSCHGLSDIPGRDSVGEQVWAAFSRSSRDAQEVHDEMTRSRSRLESRLGELSAEAHELRIRLSDLEMQAAARVAAHTAIQDRLRELETDNQRLAEERDGVSRLASELRATLDGREASCQEQARLIAGRDAEIAALDERAALAQRLEEDRETRQAEMETIRARLGELEADNRRLGEERDHAVALCRELDAGLAESETARQEQATAIAARDREIAALAERAAQVHRLEEDRQARQAEIEVLRARESELETDNRRLRVGRDQAEVMASAAPCQAGRARHHRRVIGISIGGTARGTGAGERRDPRCQRIGRPARRRESPGSPERSEGSRPRSPRWERASSPSGARPYRSRRRDLPTTRSPAPSWRLATCPGRIR